jgi:hypothetical protein
LEVVEVKRWLKGKYPLWNGEEKVIDMLRKRAETHR